MLICFHLSGAFSRLLTLFPFLFAAVIASSSRSGWNFCFVGFCNVHRHFQGNSKQSPPPPPQILSLQLKPWVHIECCGTRKELVKQHTYMELYLVHLWGRQAYKGSLPSWLLCPSCVLTLAIPTAHEDHVFSLILF